MCDRQRVGDRWPNRASLDRYRAVVREPVRPILELRSERTVDEERSEAGAIDEQVTLDPLAGFELQRGDVSACPVQLHFADLALNPLRALSFRHRAQELRVERRIELIGVVHPVVGQMRELARVSGGKLQAIIVVGLVVAALEPVQPEMLEAGAPMVLPGSSETVEVAMADVLPILEADAELERRLGGAHEIDFVDSEQPIVGDK